MRRVEVIRVEGLWFRISACAFRVFMFWVLGFGFLCCGFWVSFLWVFGFWVFGLVLRIHGVVCLVYIVKLSKCNMS